MHRVQHSSPRHTGLHHVCLSWLFTTYAALGSSPRMPLLALHHVCRSWLCTTYAALGSSPRMQLLALHHGIRGHACFNHACSSSPSLPLIVSFVTHFAPLILPLLFSSSMPLLPSSHQRRPRMTQYGPALSMFPDHQCRSCTSAQVFSLSASALLIKAPYSAVLFTALSQLPFNICS